MFFLSTPFPHLLPFVLKGSWQIGKGLQAMHRKLWNTMRGRRQIPTHLRKSLVSVVRDPRGDGWSWSHIFAPFTERRQCSQRGAEQSKAGSRGSKTKQDTKTHEISQIAKWSPLPRAPEFYESSFSFPKSLCSVCWGTPKVQSREWEKWPQTQSLWGIAEPTARFSEQTQPGLQRLPLPATPPNPDICPSGTLNRHLHPNGVKFRLRNEGHSSIWNNQQGLTL